MAGAYILLVCSSTRAAEEPLTVVESAVGKVEFMPAGGREWQLMKTGLRIPAGYIVRCGENSFATIRMLDLTILRVPETTTMEVPAKSNGKSDLRIDYGSVYTSTRNNPRELLLRGRAASGAILQTELIFTVAANGQISLTMIDGEFQLSNTFGTVIVRSGERGIAETNSAPTKTNFTTLNVIQWILYYPAVLNVDDLALTAEERMALGDSLAAYHSGDLIRAFESYPFSRRPQSDSERIYRAALLLIAGQIASAEEQLAAVTQLTRLASALQEQMAAVKFELFHRPAAPTNATELLAASYYEQSRSQLPQAREMARQATNQAPLFSLAWSRLAELEFSFGRADAAKPAIQTAIRLAPRNAQALALRGFILSAQNQFPEAQESFNEAIAINSALPAAWLGRGLVRISRGQREEGRRDLQVAAALDPTRAVLRSYLGKAFSYHGDQPRARHELDLATRMDPRDPTSWLYAALLNQQDNRINEAVRDLERSQQLNTNRSVFRSALLLDQDRAVRSANLAAIYRDAGMIEVSTREASQAVQSDYGNYSAHLFLANSYDQLRDPRQINLRYESAWLNEYLLANLLAPVGAGSLSPTISEQEYSRFFEGNRVGVVSSTEYFSSGDWVQSGSQFGRYDNFSYAIDANYRIENGQRPNNDQEQTTLSLQLKHQITPKNSVYVQVITYDAEGGDLTQYYHQTNANPEFRVKEKQHPLFIAGFHREWSPGNHTLLLAGWLSDEVNARDPRQLTPLGTVEKRMFVVETNFNLPLVYSSELEIYTAELQQILQVRDHGFILGGRWQSGNFETHSLQTDPVGSVFFPPSGIAANLTSETEFERVSLYAYDNWRLSDSLLLTAGITYDRLHFPENFRQPPISDRAESRDRLSPKAGFFWNVTDSTRFRASYTRSLGGVSFDQSFRLEPTQIGGFNQSFRSIIPEAITGAAAAPTIDVAGVGADQRVGKNTYLGIEAQLLESEVRRSIGAFKYRFESSPPLQLRERLEYEEQTLSVNFNQLLDDEWSLGTRYRVSRAELHDQFPQVRAPATDSDALLHQLTVFALFNHRSGIFAQADAIWSLQENSEVSMPGDDFWQFNLFAGYRFPRRRAELRVGVLNITGQDYRLNPLNLYAELPRERTLVASMKFNF